MSCWNVQVLSPLWLQGKYENEILMYFVIIHSKCGHSVETVIQEELHRVWLFVMYKQVTLTAGQADKYLFAETALKMQ